MVARAVQQEAQATAGIFCVLAWIISLFEQAVAGGNISQETGVSPHGSQTVRAVARGREELASPLGFVFGEEIAVGLRADQPDIGVRHRPSEQRGEPHLRSSESFREGEQAARLLHLTKVLDGYRLPGPAPRVPHPDDPKRPVFRQEACPVLGGKSLQQALHRFQNPLMCSFVVR